MDQAILDEAMAVTSGDRHESYGDPGANHGRTAALWSVYLGVEVTARDVCLMNILQKVSRETHNPKRDNLVDIAGYAANAGKCPVPAVGPAGRRDKETERRRDEVGSVGAVKAGGVVEGGVDA